MRRLDGIRKWSEPRKKNLSVDFLKNMYPLHDDISSVLHTSERKLFNSISAPGCSRAQLCNMWLAKKLAILWRFLTTHWNLESLTRKPSVLFCCRKSLNRFQIPVTCAIWITPCSRSLPDVRWVNSPLRSYILFRVFFTGGYI